MNRRVIFRVQWIIRNVLRRDVRAQGFGFEWIESVKKNALDDKRYERKETKSGHPMFNLTAANYEIVGISEGSNIAPVRENGIESVKTNAPEATVVDETA